MHSHLSHSSLEVPGHSFVMRDSVCRQGGAGERREGRREGRRGKRGCKVEEEMGAVIGFVGEHDIAIKCSVK